MILIQHARSIIRAGTIVAGRVGWQLLLLGAVALSARSLSATDASDLAVMFSFVPIEIAAIRGGLVPLFSIRLSSPSETLGPIRGRDLQRAVEFTVLVAASVVAVVVVVGSLVTGFSVWLLLAGGTLSAGLALQLVYLDGLHAVGRDLVLCALVGVATPAVALIAMGLVTATDAGVEVVVVALIAPVALSTLLSRSVLVHATGVRNPDAPPRTIRSVASSLGGQVSALYVMNLAWIASSATDVAVLRWAGKSNETLGYLIASRLALIGGLPVVVIQGVGGRLMGLEVSTRTEKLKRLRRLGLLASGVWFVLCVVAGPFVLRAMGADAGLAMTPLVMLAAAQLTATLSAIDSLKIMHGERSVMMAVGAVGGAILSVSLSVVLSQRFGGAGVATGTALSVVAYKIWLSWLSAKVSGATSPSITPLQR
jgi:hypothetical protein